eukprot:942343-Pyramimonas_sp.AAC.1
MDDIGYQCYDAYDAWHGGLNNRFSYVCIDAAGGSGHYHIGEGILQGQQGASSKNNRVFQRRVLEPWLQQWAATPDGAQLLRASPCHEEAADLSTTAFMDGVAHKVIGASSG